VSPAGPDPGQASPEQAVDRAELRAGCLSLVDGKLLAHGQVFEGELTVAADEEWEEPKQVKHKGDHEPRLWPAVADRSITRRADEVLAKEDRARYLCIPENRRRCGSDHLTTQRFQIWRTTGSRSGVPQLTRQAALDVVDSDAVQ
jgi:hypothetical protein